MNASGNHHQEAAQDPIVDEILSYWRNHPNACDTVEGIMEWWLTGRAVSRSEVEEALSKLVSRGLVIRQARKDGRVFYRFSARTIR